MRTRALMAFVLLLAACEEPYSNEDLRFMKSLPNQDLVRIELPDRDPDPEPGELAKYHLLAQTISSTVNTAVFGTLATIGEITETPPSVRTEERREWGPFTRDGLEYTLTITITATQGIRVPTSTASIVPIDERYDFVLSARRQREPEVQADILGGQFAPLEDGKRGIGWLQLNFEAALYVDPTRTDRGFFGAGYDTRDGSVDLAGAYYLPRAEALQAPDAYYRFRTKPSKETDFYYGAYLDVSAQNGAPTSALETFVLFARWRPDQRGRADAAVFGGDLPENGALVSAECWDEHFRRKYFRTLYLDPDPAKGDITDCAPELREAIYFPN
jgi:hypothetical protein